MKNFLKNRWTKFTIASIAYILLFVVWTGNPWLLLGLPFIYDHFISRLVYRYIGTKNDALRALYALQDVICQRYGSATRSIFLLRVVNLLDSHIVSLEAIHQLRQVAIESEGDIYAQ